MKPWRCSCGHMHVQLCETCGEMRPLDTNARPQTPLTSKRGRVPVQRDMWHRPDDELSEAELALKYPKVERR